MFKTPSVLFEGSVSRYSTPSSLTIARCLHYVPPFHPPGLSITPSSLLDVSPDHTLFGLFIIAAPNHHPNHSPVGFKYYVCPFLRAVLATNATQTESGIRNICIRRQHSSVNIISPRIDPHLTAFLQLALVCLDCPSPTYITQYQIPLHAQTFFSFFLYILCINS